MTPSFNLVDEKWLPVVRRGPVRQEFLGLRDVLRKARECAGLLGATPPETAALYRLLLAVLYRAFPLETGEARDYEEHWRILWNRGAFDAKRLDEYLEVWLGRFDLFHPERPFYQDARLQRSLESVSSLLPHAASGADATLFDHSVKNLRNRKSEEPESWTMTLTPAEAARALVMIHAYGPAGTKGRELQFKLGPCANGLLFFLEGDTLFETLMLNLCDPDLRSYRLPARPDDRPAWEMDDPYEEHPNRPLGYIDYLTWQNRRVLLQPETSNGRIVVRKMMYAPGLSVGTATQESGGEPVTNSVFNPQMHWRASTQASRSSRGSKEKRSHYPVRLEPGKALWRDAEVLLRLPPDESKGRDKPPRCLAWVEGLVPSLLPIERVYRYLAFGAAGERGKDKTYYYRMEVMPLPLAYLKSEELLSRLSQGLRAARTAGRALESSFPSAIYTLARLVVRPTTGDDELAQAPSGDEGKSIVRLADSWSVERHYWSQLELHFHQLVENLSRESEQALAQWLRQVRRLAWESFEQAEDYAGHGLRGQRAVARARDQFHADLARALGDHYSDEGEMA